MKRIILLLVFCVGMTAMSYGKVIARGESNTPFGSYTIELCDQPMAFAGEEMKCYLISYSESPVQLKVYVDKERKCKNYIVLSDDLAVMYSCDGNIFGVNKVDKKFKNAGIVTDDSKLDRMDYFHQKVIARGETSDFEAAALIASFFPQLIS
jgi:hypothetical protein